MRQPAMAFGGGGTGDAEAAPWLHYWAKSSAGGKPYHLFACHSLDVAAVLDAWMDRDPRILRALASAVGCDPVALRGWLLFLAAMHDCGKLSSRFQALAPELVREFGRIPSDVRYESGVRHDTLGAVALSDRVLPALAATYARGTPTLGERTWLRYLRSWIEPVAGHHGTPPRSIYPETGASIQISTAWTVEAGVPDHTGLAAVDAFTHALGDSFGWSRVAPTPSDGNLPRASRAVRAASWHLAGLVVVCDWLASAETHWRDLADAQADLLATGDLRAYWAASRKRAELAIQTAGFLPVPATAFTSVREAFGVATPTPLQVETSRVGLPDGASLWIVEDVTGAGKTEAVLALVHRLVQAGAADGLYFGLPTQATANAMVDRVKPWFQRLYTDPSRASLVLAHAGVQTRSAFTDLDPESGERGGEPDGRREARQWLADNRKKTLLAHVGVGTIDQVLLGILPVKYQSLRLFGVTSRVLVVDEVHAFDEYVVQLLEVLIEFQARSGAPTVLVSATLPASTRSRFIAAFRRGTATLEAPVDAETEGPAPFPLLTRVDGQSCESIRVEAREGGRRETRVEFVHSFDEACTLVRACREAGKATCWIRNSVADAREAFGALADADPILLHSRFLAEDRRRLENEIKRRAGPTSGPADRRGLTVIATQVLEQSLDIDFDCMITDLAPIDLILQRAGRLRRHARGADGERLQGAPEIDERGPATLHVFAPPWSEEPAGDWLTSVLPRTARVYKSVDRLWLTQRALRTEGTLRVPERLRAIMAMVYDEPAPIPAALQPQAQRAEGEAHARRSRASVTTLNLAAGYVRDASNWDDDVRARTRDADPTIDVYFARRDGSAFQPLAGTWDSSRLSVRYGELLPIQIGDAEAVARLPFDPASNVLMVVSTEGSTFHGTGTGKRGPVHVTYSPRRGLEISEAEE